MTRLQVAIGAGIGAMFLLGTMPGCTPGPALLLGLIVTAVVYGGGEA